MVDEYVSGSVSRLSPESIAPVILPRTSERFPGGAANVAMNLSGLGCDVAIFGVVGNDEPGQWLRTFLESRGVDSKGLLEDPSRPTTYKKRYNTARDSLLRVDTEHTDQISSSISASLAGRLTELARNRFPIGLIISDYCKGCLRDETSANELLSSVGKLAANTKISAVDTKSTNPSRIFSNFLFSKLNLLELERVLGHEVASEDNSLRRGCREYLAKHGGRSVLISLGHKGVFCFGEAGEFRVPAPAGRGRSVAGAGDCLVATTVWALAKDMSWKMSLKVACLAVSIVIKNPGTNAVTLRDLSQRMGRIFVPTTEGETVSRPVYRLSKGRTVVFTNGCFDLLHFGHVASLRFAKSLGDYLIVGINDDNSVRHLKGSPRPLMTLSMRTELLKELRSVDEVIPFSETDAARLIEKIRPDIYVKGEEYDLPNTREGKLVLGYGGKLVNSPIVRGISTTYFIRRIRSLDEA